MTRTQESSRALRYPAYGWLGVLMVLGGEIALFVGLQPVPTYFTPWVWTGYILAVDGLTFRLTGGSLLTTRRAEFWSMLPLSILCWLVFEGYNRLTGSWEYIGLPESAPARLFGYAWSFATIFPAIFETAELLRVTVFGSLSVQGRLRMGQTGLALMSGVGAVALLAPIIWPSGYLIPLVWAGFILLLEPINYWLGAPSLLRQWERGEWGWTGAFLASGVICGLLWEFWNYWAVARWIYHVPYLPQIKLFEMPLLGYLGFLPFALECFAMYSTALYLLRGPLRLSRASPWWLQEPSRYEA